MPSKAQRLSASDLSLFPTCSWDLETTNLKADFGYMLCAGIKPFRKPVKVFRIDQYEGYDDDRCDDSKLVADVAAELVKYTIAIGYNTQRFDVPFLIGRMLYHGLDVRPLSTLKHLDLIWAARYRMRLHSARLDSVIQHLHAKTTKTPLIAEQWNRAASGHKDGIDFVVRHNEHDCKALEEVAVKMAPLIDLKFALIR